MRGRCPRDVEPGTPAGGQGPAGRRGSARRAREEGPWGRGQGRSESVSWHQAPPLTCARPCPRDAERVAPRQARRSAPGAAAQDSRCQAPDGRAERRGLVGGRKEPAPWRQPTSGRWRGPVRARELCAPLSPARRPRRGRPSPGELTPHPGETRTAASLYLSAATDRALMAAGPRGEV